MTPPIVRASRIATVLDVWHAQNGIRLTRAEREILEHAADGLTLLQIAAVRGTALGTVRRQSKNLLAKTGDDTLALAAIRLLGEAAGLP